MALKPLFECRAGCAACCIAPSITSPIPDMPQGKPAGIPCIQLDSQGLCKLFNQATRPSFCSSLCAQIEMCGQSKEEAMTILDEWERLTSPT